MRVISCHYSSASCQQGACHLLTSSERRQQLLLALCTVLDIVIELRGEPCGKLRVAIGLVERECDRRSARTQAQAQGHLGSARYCLVLYGYITECCLPSFPPQGYETTTPHNQLARTCFMYVQPSTYICRLSVCPFPLLIPSTILPSPLQVCTVQHDAGHAPTSLSYTLPRITSLSTRAISLSTRT